MAKENSTVPKALNLSRIVYAPLELVWKAWTDSAMIAQWWGPEGFTNPVCNWEPVPGKKIYIDMKAPTGELFPMDGSFQEVIPMDKLVFTASALDENGRPLFEILHTVRFLEENGQTKISILAEARNITPRGEAYLEGQELGWTQSLIRLNHFLSNTNRELRFERIFNAPNELVFEAWTRPEHLANWWGPTGFTLTTKKMEAKPGGIWQFIMHGPDGRDYPNKIQFIEVDPPKHISYKHLDDIDSEPVSFHVNVYFTDLGDQTKVNMHMQFMTADDLVRVSREYGAIEGAHQTLARLSNLVESQIYVSRIIDASREKVWRAWTDTSILKNWWGPNGFTNSFQEFDLREGGKARFIIHGPDGKDYPNEISFLKILEPEMIMWDHLSAPRFLMVGEFEEIDKSHTRVIFRQIFGDPEDCSRKKTFVGKKNEENLDRLETELKNLDKPPSIS